MQAFDAGREVTTEDIVVVARATTPLSSTMREATTALREWAATRARPAAVPEEIPRGGRRLQALADAPVTR